jgi:hypothetical protein
MEHRAVWEEIDAYFRSTQSERVEGLMPFISYAQNYEDIILWRALRDIERGFYVDIGAADPEEYSVTCAFYQRGWPGINVEPLDDYFEKLTNTRPRDANLKVAAGRETGLRIFQTFPGYGSVYVRSGDRGAAPISRLAAL